MSYRGLVVTVSITFGVTLWAVAGLTMYLMG